VIGSSPSFAGTNTLCLIAMRIAARGSPPTRGCPGGLIEGNDKTDFRTRKAIRLRSKVPSFDGQMTSHPAPRSVTRVPRW